MSLAPSAPFMPRLALRHQAIANDIAVRSFRRLLDRAVALARHLNETSIVSRLQPKSRITAVCSRRIRFLKLPHAMQRP